MVCLRIFRRHWICSTFVFSLFLLFSVFGLSQNSYATTNTCDLSSLDDYNYNRDFGDTSSSACPGLFDSFSSSTSTLYLSYDISFHVVNTDPIRSFSLYNNAVSNGWSRAYFIGVNTYGLSSGDYSLSGFNSFLYSNRPNHIWFNFFQGDRSAGAYLLSFHLSVSDEAPSSGEPEPCPVCPEIPENPYDNKFDALTKAIYCCGAILIMLYFFFCIYKIIVKDGGSR